MAMKMFNTTKELDHLKAKRKIKYARRHGRSRLDRYAGQILALHLAGASATLIQDYLADHRIKVALSTVTRWLQKNG